VQVYERQPAGTCGLEPRRHATREEPVVGIVGRIVLSVPVRLNTVGKRERARPLRLGVGAGIGGTPGEDG
jgi:hypothetical protein